MIEAPPVTESGTELRSVRAELDILVLQRTAGRDGRLTPMQADRYHKLTDRETELLPCG
jgi:hypothetical protein